MNFLRTTLNAQKNPSNASAHEAFGEECTRIRDFINKVPIPVSGKFQCLETPAFCLNDLRYTEHFAAQLDHLVNLIKEYFGGRVVAVWYRQPQCSFGNLGQYVLGITDWTEADFTRQAEMEEKMFACFNENVQKAAFRESFPKSSCK